MEDSKNYFEILRSSKGWKASVGVMRTVEAVIVFSVMMMVFVNTVARYLFNANFSWIEEMLTIFAMWMYFLGGVIGAEEESHIYGDLVSGSLRSQKVKKWLTVGVNLLNTLCAAFFTYLAIAYCVQQTKFGVTTAYLRLPKGTSQYAVGFGMIGMTFYWLFHTLRYLFKKPSEYELAAAASEENLSDAEKESVINKEDNCQEGRE